MHIDSRITLDDPDELIPIPPEVAYCPTCNQPLKAQIQGWSVEGEDRWVYDPATGSSFILFCGCGDWEPVESGRFSCHCCLYYAEGPAGAWLDAQHIICYAPTPCE
jgi:hypothetical protein